MSFLAAFTLLVSCSPSFSHSLPDARTRSKLENATDAADRYRRMQRFQTHRLSRGLQRRALAKIGTIQQKAVNPGAQNTVPSRFAAFPFTAKPELKSRGRTKTLAVMVDFKDLRGETVLPGLTADAVAKNIFGPGTPTAQNKYFPFESLHNYYLRASENKLDVVGDVLGWVHLSKNRSRYEPAYPKSATEDVKSELDNRAIFKIATETFDKIDAQTDFAQFDNDNDGDIDLVTIMYAGPNTGWGGFWWAYRWEFFVADASTKKYDGKRLNQFVFQFVSTRADDPKDFDPTTLMHEYGHALGLPDYYDYCSKEAFESHQCSSSIQAPGPDGDIGGLDMMAANKGNHNAISRWLLDWIEPRAVSSAPETVTLAASGGTADGSPKAIAVFPSLQQSNTPSNELFLIENRARVGNDSGIAGMPADGLIVWHVDATPNPQKSDFSYDNSYAEHKFVRLVRAGSGVDFRDGERASRSDYYIPGKVLTPSSIPNSNDYAKSKTGVTLTEIAINGSNVVAKVGVVKPSVPPVAISSRSTAMPPKPRSVQPPPSTSLATTAAELAPVRGDEISAEYEDAKPEDLAQLWQTQKDALDFNQVETETAIRARLILTHWALKNGPAAANAILNVPLSPFLHIAFPEVMAAWADSNPGEVDQWYFADAQAQLRQGTDIVAGQQFARSLFRWRGLSQPVTAVAAIDQLYNVSEVYGAVEGLREAAAMSGATQAIIDARLKKLSANQKRARAVSKLLDANKEVVEHFSKRDGEDPAEFLNAK